MNGQNGYIYNSQQTLFNNTSFKNREVIGYKKNKIMVRLIHHLKANELIKKNHYSKTIVNNSIDHFGFYIDGDLLGVLQFGHMLNPAAYKKLIPSTKGIEDYRELNRMFLYDEAPRNSESQAISLCIKVLKKKYGIKWVQSFADERCGKLGIVYQAANFLFYGHHNSEFYEYKKRAYHKIRFTKKDRIKTLENRYNTTIEQIKKEAKKHELRQFRYIYFVDRSLIKECTLTPQKYPKHYIEVASS